MDERTKNLIWDIVFRWIILGFLFCFVPLAFTYLYDCIVGYRFEFEDVLSDLCLCVFAVTINAFSNEVDVRKYKGEYIRLIMIFISLTGATICLFMSSIVIAHRENGQISGVKVVYTINAIIIASQALIGIIIELISFFQNRLERHGDSGVAHGENE